LRKYLFVVGVLLLYSGCQVAKSNSGLPDGNQVIRDQLVIQSDVRLPARHRLVNELVAGRDDLCQKLNLPTSDEPINVYLFKDERSYLAFMGEQYPGFPGRRAIFVKNDTTLKVFAFWGERVGEDLRHEVTHAYLHSVVPNVPLWLDEGLAEYFEVGRGRHGIHPMHVAALAEAYRGGNWLPNLKHLEQLKNSDEMTELEYAESWCWTHFLLESTPDNLTLVQAQMARLRMNAEAEPLAEQIDKQLPNAANQLVEHLRSLAERQSTNEIANAQAK
jgi:uncharacterized protein DUF1570